MAYPAYSTYTLASRDAEVAEFVHDRFESCKNVKGVQISSVDILAERGFVENSVDLMIVSNPRLLENDSTDILKRLRTVLVPGGRLMIVDLLLDHNLEDVIFGKRNTQNLYSCVGPSFKLRIDHWLEALMNAGYIHVELATEDVTLVLASSPKSTVLEALPDSSTQLRTDPLWVVSSSIPNCVIYS